MFCSTSVSDNGTRMMAHIKLCKEINDDERESYISGDRGNLVFSTFDWEDGMGMDVIEIEDDNAIEDSSDQNPPQSKKNHQIPQMFSKSGKTVLRI